MSVSGMQQSKWLDSVVQEYFPPPLRFHRCGVEWAQEKE